MSESENKRLYNATNFNYALNICQKFYGWTDKKKQAMENLFLMQVCELPLPEERRFECAVQVMLQNILKDMGTRSFKEINRMVI